jgi:hypothetical protein
LERGERTSVNCNIDMQATCQKPRANRCELRTASPGHWVEGQQQKLGAMARARGRGTGGRRGRRINEQIVEATSQELEAHIQNLESQCQSEEERNNKRGAKSEELGVNDPMSPHNPMTTVCLCLCVLEISVLEIFYVYVYICVRRVIEVGFNNKPHTHTHTHSHSYNLEHVYAYFESLKCG